MDAKEVVLPFMKNFMLGEKKDKTIRLTKLANGETPKYSDGHPNNIEVGFTYEGLMPRPVAVGESFYVNYPNEPHFHTSVVQEILSHNTFKTMNSIYKWEILK